MGASDATGVGVDDPQRDGWVPVLARRLPPPTRPVNLGIPGVKLREALNAELPPALDALRQASGGVIVTVWLVVNDILGGVALDHYRADLAQLLSQLVQARDPGGTVVAVGNVPDAGKSSRYLGMSAAQRQAVTRDWNAAIAAVVERQGCLPVDLYGRWPVAQHPEYIGQDGLHPTVAGYRTLADTFLAVLREQRVV